MKRSWRNPLILLVTCFVGCLVLLAYPLYVIRPFRYQGATELSVALEMMRIRTAVVGPLAVLAAVVGLVTWRRTSRLIARASVVLLTALTVICAALSSVNVYELMF